MLLEAKESKGFAIMQQSLWDYEQHLKYFRFLLFTLVWQWVTIKLKIKMNNYLCEKYKFWKTTSSPIQHLFYIRSIKFTKHKAELKITAAGLHILTSITDACELAFYLENLSSIFILENLWNYHHNIQSIIMHNIQQWEYFSSVLFLVHFIKRM